MIPFDPADLWMWGAGGDEPPVPPVPPAGAAGSTQAFAGVLQTISDSGSISTQLGAI